MIAAYRRHRRDGFTLMEVVIVVTLTGLVAAVIAAVFTTIARTTPVTEARADDARSLLGLTTWLPQDVGSARPSSFEPGPHASDCGSGVDPSSQGLLQMSWTEGGTTLVADYRYLSTGAGTGRVVRYSCPLGGAAELVNMTAPLLAVAATGSPPYPSEGPAPVDLTMLPLGCSIPNCTGVNFEVVVVDDGGATRSLLTLDAYSLNVQTTLPPPTTTGSATTTTAPTAGNNAPFAADLHAEIFIDAAPFQVVLPVLDADLDPLDVTITSISPEIEAVKAGAAPSISVDLRALSANGAVHEGTYEFRYTVSDGTDVSNEAVVSVHAHDIGTPATPATSTSTSTTTTTTVPCVASIASVSPSSVARKTSGHLDTDVTVSISASGSCGPLVLTFDPDTADANTTPQQIAFNLATSVTIGRNAYTWQQPAAAATPWVFPLQLREGAGGPVKDTGSLTVTP